MPDKTDKEQRMAKIKVHILHHASDYRVYCYSDTRRTPVSEATYHNDVGRLDADALNARYCLRCVNALNAEANAAR